MTNPLSLPPQIHSLLSTLHAKSLAQEAALPSSTFSPSSRADRTSFDALMSDKFIALDQDKCEFVYQTLRASGATTVVEAGTSYGVSTIYLALGVLANLQAKDNANGNGSGQGQGQGVGKGKVVATEKEPGKAALAREYWTQAGRDVAGVIELREGDLRETLTSGGYGEEVGEEGVGLVLLDIWTPMALPALKAVQDKLKPGAVIIADNTLMAKDGYQELFEYVDQEGGPFKRITLPYKGGMDMIVYK
ncbi:S-adenosyl-L-methionine-dependent methyltransferase [Aspergillus steynii IBT 23096]|uniref:S-adenosyl-L-methionine-dependent methyltransferase n=1 Tax=Aspergillus steynii IBT 23096 TaxID=1392250 RepID=A0A2I2G1A3_9EURO|nr:S-adenosyl-L-methionine-dependent methyltransferase [Aspergillus steynii IBT 23096]PLB46658.1 S-adenosyl-L-methionine-dependent methyltransferase [Aspergillus steynii IBT 23096]